MSTGKEPQTCVAEIIEELNLHFQPIAHLFDVMGAADSGVQGVFVRRWAEIGMHLATNFRKHLDQIATKSKE